MGGGGNGGGVVWCGVVWCGLVWYGLVWPGVVWCGLVWSGVVWCGLVWSGVVWRGLVWSGLVWSGLGQGWSGLVWAKAPQGANFKSHGHVPLAYQNGGIWHLCSPGHMQGPVGSSHPHPHPPSRGKGSTGSQLQKSWTCAPGIPEWKHLTTVLTWPHARPCRLELLSWSWLTPTWALVESRGLHTKSGAPITTEWPCLRPDQTRPD